MYYAWIKKHTDLLLRKVLKQDVDEEIKRVEEEFYKGANPVRYGGKKGLLLKLERNFETNCVILKQNGVIDPKKIPLVEFYQTIKILEKQQTHGKSKRHKKA